jgi:hypothetical protein
MSWKIAIACLAGLGTVVNADDNGQFGIDNCPVGYALTTYVVTRVKNSTTAVNNWATGLPTAVSWQATSTQDEVLTFSSSPTSVNEAETSAAGSAPTQANTYSPTVPASVSSSLVIEPSQSSALSLQPSPSPLAGGVVHGQATSYDDGEVSGTCMFSTADYTLPAGIYGAALSVNNWDSAAWCGACVSVVGPGGKSVKIMVSRKIPLHK